MLDKESVDWNSFNIPVLAEARAWQSQGCGKSSVSILTYHFDSI
jgi:hypothetical protein